MASSAGSTETGLVSVTNLGVGGVNLVKDPLEMADNEVLFAQNAEPYREQGVAGVRKRPGLQRVSGTGAVSPIIITVPFAPPTDPTTPTIYLPTSPSGGPSSPDGGTTYTPSGPMGDGTLLPNVKYSLNIGGPYEFLASYPACWCPNARMYVLGAHAAGSILVSSSPGNFKQVTVFSASVTLDDTLVLPYPYYDYNGNEFAVVVTVSGTAGQIMLYQPATGATLILPNLTSTPIATGCVGYGIDSAHWYLWVANGANISTIRPGIDTSWTDNAVGGGGETLLGLVMNGAYLFAGTKQSGTTGPRILRCLMSGATCSVSGSVSWTSGGGPLYAFGPFIVNGKMFASVWGGNGATLTGGDAGAADIVDQRHILKATGNTAALPKWRANEAQGGLDVQVDSQGFNSSSSRILGPILGVLGTPFGYWYGYSNQSGNTFSVAKSWYSVNWTYPANPQSLGSNTITYPMMIW